MNQRSEEFDSLTKALQGDSLNLARLKLLALRLHKEAVSPVRITRTYPLPPLPPRYNQLLTSCLLHLLSHHRVARILHCPPSPSPLFRFLLSVLVSLLPLSLLVLLLSLISSHLLPVRGNVGGLQGHPEDLRRLQALLHFQALLQPGAVTSPSPPPFLPSPPPSTLIRLPASSHSRHLLSPSFLFHASLSPSR